MDQDRRDAVATARTETSDQPVIQRAPQVERPTIPHSELPVDLSDSPIAIEWNFYRHEVGRLLAEGQEGKWVLIKGEKIIGIWDTEQRAYEAALKEYLLQPVLIRQILAKESVLRGPTSFRSCRS